MRTTFLSLIAFILLGCSNDNKQFTQASVKPFGTKENAQLVIKIDTNPQQESNQTVETNSTNKIPVNFLPKAVATANGKSGYVNATVDETVFFDSSKSSNIDTNLSLVVWTDMDNNILNNDTNFTRTFHHAGVYEKTLSIFDIKGTLTQDRVCVLVDITKDEIPMMANAGMDIETTSNSNITLEGRIICKDGDYSYTWSENGKILASTKRFTKTYAPGNHTIALKIIDNDSGHIAYDSVNINVKADN